MTGITDADSIKQMSKKIDRLLLRYATTGVFALFVIGVFPHLYQGYLLLAKSSTWVSINRFNVFVDRKDGVQKLLIDRVVSDPPLSLKSIWKVKDAETKLPYCYREVPVVFEQENEFISIPLDKGLRTCDRRAWPGKKLIISAHFTFTLQYGIQKEFIVSSPAFVYVGDGNGPTQ